MTDIVERLRNWSIDDVAETARDGTIEPGDILRWAALMREAADEIERLRAENERLAHRRFRRYQISEGS